MISPEQLREPLISVLDKNRTQFGLNAAAIVFQLRVYGFIAKEAEVVQALEYLVGKNLVDEVNPEINRAIRVWKITTLGIRYVDEHNL